MNTPYKDKAISSLKPVHFTMVATSTPVIFHPRSDLTHAFGQDRSVFSL